MFTELSKHRSEVNSMPLSFLSESTSRKRKVFLSRGEIVEAAARIMARDGYDALNMRSVAAELRVQAAALYRYVKSRGELDELIFDHLMAGCTPKVTGKDWRVDVRTICNAWRTRLNEKHDITRIALGQISLGPNVAPLMEASLNALRRSGLDDAGVVDAYDACILFVHSFASTEAAYRSLLSRGDAAGARPPILRPEWTSAYPTLTALADKLSAPPNFDAQFRFGLDALIAGIERRAHG
jgi:AcrR family transcriptional regulator